jgi:hypothetical protein
MEDQIIPRFAIPLEIRKGNFKKSLICVNKISLKKIWTLLLQESKNKEKISLRSIF